MSNLRLKKSHSKFLVLILLSLCLKANAQQVDLSQFYTSQFEPEELNQNSEERVKLLYEEHKVRYDERTRIDEKQFVYKYNYHLDKLNRSGNIFYGDSISKYLNELKDFIVEDEALRKRIKVYLTNFPYLNAFTNDFGNIYVNIATIALIDSEEELMYMIAHEIGHVMLRHSHKREVNEEENNRKWNSNDDESNFERHAFSRAHELEADSVAFALLKDRIPADFALKLISQLNTSSNPIYSGPVDFGLLTGNHGPTNDFLVARWDSTLTDSVYYEIENDDSLSTHPSSANRKTYIEELSEGYSSEGVVYNVSGKLAEVQGLARYLLLDSYIDNGMLVEALDLSLKLRARNGDEEFLKTRQIKTLTALVQRKYYGNKYDRILNIRGNACSDEDFLRLNKIILELSPLDFNIVANKSINALIGEETNPAISHAQEKSYQFLYKGYPSLFVEDSVNTDLWSHNTWEDANEELFEEDKEEDDEDDENHNSKLEDDSENDVAKGGETESGLEIDDWGYVYIEVEDTSYLAKTFLDSSEITEMQIEYVNTYSNSLKDSTFSVSVYNMRDILSAPHRSVWYFFRGKFLKSSKFDNEATTALIKSDNLCFNSRSKRNYKLNYEKSLELENTMNELHHTYPQYNHDISNRRNDEESETITVFDNYLHGAIKKWMDDISYGEDLIYSPVDDLIHEHVYNKGISYLVYRLCIVTRNTGLGKKHYINYYEIYFDIENDGVAYLTKIASKMPPDRFQLEQLIYLSAENKNDEE